MTLVFPRVRYRTGDPPLGLAYLAAVLRRERPGLALHLVDGTFLGGPQHLLRAVRDTRPDVVAVFVDSLMLPLARRVARMARAEGAVALAGGPAATVAPQLLLPDFDAVLRGEGELAIAELVDRALARARPLDVPNVVLPGPDGAPVHTATAARHPDLDALPFPAWDLLDMPRYLRLWPYLDSMSTSARGTNVVGSRGCPWRCAYCQPTLSALFGPTVRRRSPEGVAAEVAELQRRYAVDGVFFHDDTITANRPWLLELCERLRALPRPVRWGCNSRVDVLTPELVDAMVAAGMRSVHLGIEAGSARVRRDVLRKAVDPARLEALLEHVQRRGAHALGFFMLGAPTETLGEMLATVRLARRLRLTEATFSITSVLPGTDLHARVTRDPRFALLPGSSLDYYNRRNFADRQSRVGATTLRALQLAGLGAFYLHPHRARYLARHLATPTGLAKLAMKARRFLPTGE